MNRERALKVVLVLVGLLFAAATYPTVIMVRSVLQPHEENALPIVLKTADEAMTLSLYATLVMAVMAIQVPTARASG